MNQISSDTYGIVVETDNTDKCTILFIIAGTNSNCQTNINSEETFKILNNCYL